MGVGGGDRQRNWQVNAHTFVKAAPQQSTLETDSLSMFDNAVVGFPRMFVDVLRPS